MKHTAKIKLHFNKKYFAPTSYSKTMWRDLVAAPPQPQPPIPIEKFEFIAPTETGTHEVWKTKHKETGKYYFLKRITLTNDDSYLQKRQTSSKLDSMLEANKILYRFDAEREIVATRLVRLFLGNEACSPETVLLVKEAHNGKAYHWVASQEVPGYTNLGQLGKVKKEKQERFFVGAKGETRLWLNDNTHIETYGRIRVKFALLAAGEQDGNPENIGIAGEGDKRPIASIDHGHCLKTFLYHEHQRSTYPQLLAMGGMESPIGIIDLRNIEYIKRRVVVRRESITHIAQCFSDEKAVNQIFSEGFSSNYSPEHTQRVQEVRRGLFMNGAGFIAADMLLQNGWDKTPTMAEEILSNDVNSQRLQEYLDKHVNHPSKGLNR